MLDQSTRTKLKIQAGCLGLFLAFILLVVLVRKFEVPPEAQRRQAERRAVWEKGAPERAAKAAAAEEERAREAQAAKAERRKTLPERDQLNLMYLDKVEMSPAQKLAMIHYHGSDDNPPSDGAVDRIAAALEHISANTQREDIPPEDLISRTHELLQESFPGRISMVYVAEDLAQLLPPNGNVYRLSEVCALYIEAVKQDGGQAPR
jgi:hypothetical protein